MEKLARICPVCAQPFLIHAFRMRTQKTAHCSMACYNQAKKQQHPATCHLCGSTFQATPFWRKKRKYCSQECACRARQKRVEMICHTCKTSMNIPTYYGKGRKFFYCSQACYVAMYQNTPDDFWSRIRQCVHGPSCLYCCWPWQGKSVSAGYGSMSFGGKQWLAHRLAWSLHHQMAILPGYVICHYCHNRRCCNPAHLHMGTPRDNIEDALRDGRIQRTIYPKKPSATLEQGMNKDLYAKVRIPSESLPLLQWLMRELGEQQPALLKRLIDMEVKRVEHQRLQLPDWNRL